MVVLIIGLLLTKEQMLAVFIGLEGGNQLEEIVREGVDSSMDATKGYLDLLYYWLILAFAADIWQLVQQGTISALSLQGPRFKHNVVAYWAINIPLCFLLCFVWDCGFSGLWISIIIAQVYLCFAMHYLIYNCDWQEVVDRVRLRTSCQSRVIVED